MADVLSLLSAIGGVGGLATIISVTFWLGKKFAQIDERFKLMNERFKSIDERFKSIDEKFETLERRITRRIERLANAFVNYQEFFVEFLTHEGVIKRESRELLIGEVRRIIRLSITNPLTKEEWKKIKEYIEKSEKDTITLEEAEDFRRLARKVALEHGEQPEAWKLHIYATITLALTRKKYYAEKES